jgi:hypothetical protein
LCVFRNPSTRELDGEPEARTDGRLDDGRVEREADLLGDLVHIIRYGNDDQVAQITALIRAGGGVSEIGDFVQRQPKSKRSDQDVHSTHASADRDALIASLDRLMLRSP